ncbi:carbohydrate ABC transporter permease [Paenibacillus piri]|uniref:Carbohydrate ABC transporter permease n=1 Tax=Paenibacillus piri TaxID=2547395 RepID=A0A4R5KCB3_9BACL|nr:carbohydrate ABC transporter permease [Paenibacillus piri]TDF92929.1 carbohydrate ABC transporter permease [Paenibacillus piri]
MVKHKTWGSRIFDGFNYAFLLICSLISIIPFVYIVAGSFTAAEEFVKHQFLLFPTKFSLNAYEYIFSSNVLIHSLGVSVFITVVGTIVNLAFTSIMAYPLARSDLVGRRVVMMMVVFTILFSGGIIPTFLVVKAAGLLDSIWALIIPGAISGFNLILLKNFFQQLPEGLEEAAKIDGCSEYGILFRIVLPLSLPALATFGLFYGVGHWNTYFNAILYINSPEKWPIQVWLRQIVILSQGGIGDSAQLDSEFVIPPPRVINMAVIVVATLPILAVYPFLQKHFAKGALLGSVKG